MASGNRNRIYIEGDEIPVVAMLLGDDGIEQIAVEIEGESARFKINDGIWSTTFGSRASEQSTSRVFVALFQDKEGSPHQAAGETFDLTSADGYRSDATRWLSSHSDLPSSTMDEADWPEIYEHFKERA